MPIKVVATEGLMVGRPIVVEGGSPTGRFVAVFEDDGKAGYLYALDMSAAGNPIQDTLHIYNVAQVADREVPLTLRIGWSSDSQKVVLSVNDHPHAVFDFEGRRGYCRSGFPPIRPSQEWSKEGHNWSDLAMQFFSAE